jgi:hypothetical protein
MDPRLRAILPLLILAHLSGVARGHSLASKKAGPQKSSPAVQKRPAQTSPQAQGPAGVGQGFQGQLGPVSGGMNSLANMSGILPQQNTAPSFYSLMQSGKL